MEIRAYLLSLGRGDAHDERPGFSRSHEQRGGILAARAPKTALQQPAQEDRHVENRCVASETVRAHCRRMGVDGPQLARRSADSDGPSRSVVYGMKSAARLLKARSK